MSFKTPALRGAAALLAVAALLALAAPAAAQTGSASLAGKVQDGQGQAHVIVVIAPGLANLHPNRQEMRDGILGGRFSGAAGHADYLAAPTNPRPPR